MSVNNFLQNIINGVRDDIFDDLVSIIPQEIIIREVSKNGGIVAKHTSAPSEAIDTELGSMSGGQFGYFYKPMPGSKALAIRVYPGSTNHTQIIKVISNPAQQNSDPIGSPVSDTEQGVMGDGNYEIEPGEILLRSKNNQTLLFKSYNGHDGSIELLENNGNGISIDTIKSSTFLNITSHYVQQTSAASKSFSGEYHQSFDESDHKKSSSDLYSVTRPSISTEDKIGLFYPGKAYDAKIMNNPRNVPLTFYKKTINQVTERVKFIGFENEKQILNLNNKPEDAYDNVENQRFYQSRNIYNLFYMAPDQLLQVLSGNILSENNNYNPININYNVTLFDDFKGPRDAFQVQEDNNPAFIRIKNNFKRGIGYHFQLNTHADIKEDFVSSKNTRFVLDKEGVLKVNIPKSSRYGNVMYVDDTSFMKGSDNYKPQIINGFAQPSSLEKIPVTLRDNKGKISFPAANDASSPALAVKNLNNTRYSGIQFSNSNGYFGKPEYSGLKVRVNTTKHHNMYAACEMLLANYVTAVSTPQIIGPVLHGVLTLGMAVSETFEKPSLRFSGSFSNPSQKDYQTSYGTVLVEPQDPIINPGGSLIFGGKFHQNLPIYSNNDLEKTEGDSAYSGVSANLNLEGSLEASIGADTADGKSVTLDTQGGAVMWFGKDKKNRSLSVQTDGDAMFNIGGHSNDGTWNPGRLDLRVNLTNKGLLDDEEADNNSDNLESIDSDFIISISEKGIIISGMKNDVPMMINNSGLLTLQSKQGIILNGGMGGVKVLEKNRVVKDAGVSQSNTANSATTGGTADVESIAQTFQEILDLGSTV